MTVWGPVALAVQIAPVHEPSGVMLKIVAVEIEGQLRKVMMVLKMRGGAHSKDIREYEIASKGVVIGERLVGYDHLITGIPTRVGQPASKR